MDIDSMNPDQLRRALRDALRDNEALRRRLGEQPPPFSRIAEAILDGVSRDEMHLAASLSEALR
jgi:hypothetical protein